MTQSGTPALRLVFAFIIATSVLAACTATTGTSPSAAASIASSPASATSVASPTSAGGGGPSGSAVATQTALNPCDLLDPQQVMQVNGISYGDGQLHDLSTGAVQCTWLTTSPPASVVVQVLVASSANVAEEAYAQTTAALNGFSLTQVPNFADAAVIARAPAGTVSTGGIYVRDNNTYFDVVYLNGTAPSDGQLQLTATLVLGALP